MNFMQVFTMIMILGLGAFLVYVLYNNMELREINSKLRKDYAMAKGMYINKKEKLDTLNEVLEQEKQEENKLNGKETHVLIESLKKCNDANIYLEDNENDMLISLFKKQIELQKKFYDKELPNDEPEIMGQHILALVAELGEVMQEDKRWKSWCKNPPKVDFYKKRKEIIDCFHFMINICIYSGMQAEDVYELFVEKNKVNVERQENNY